jgi:hypothetical protein
MSETRLYYSAATNKSSTVPPGLHDYAVKATPVDADELPLADSVTGWSYRRLSWANLKAAIGVWYDTAVRTMTNKTLTTPVLTSPRINIIYDTNGGVAMSIAASTKELEAAAAEVDPKIAANYFGITNSAAGVAPMFGVWGSDTNVPLHFRTKGLAGYKFLISQSGHEFVELAPNTDPAGMAGKLVVTNAGQSADNYAITLTVPASPGKPNSILNLNTEGTNGQVRANGNPVETQNRRGVANGYASLGADGKVPAAQLPAATDLVRGSSAGTATALTLWTGTKAQYDAIATKSATTIYVVTGVAAVTGDITVDEGVQTGDIAAEPATKSATTKSTRKK